MNQFLFIAGINDTGDKLFTGINDNSDKLSSGDKLLLVPDFFLFHDTGD
jgi:hypothetical protein